ncbi:DUF3311 domain-containing protein [Actinoalloteichus hymeniacidonis]|uniref:DUF3311 family protein n=1 Tax=Actinoalloteichus hymeniacidonis TaxID=340345 RepID=A0AAC9N1S7_9PSEU|nr:DUF3311 domain-containing protein [Actinoalloteichus hymeniacidonis]AOS66106.1 putative DUF3311 family protein [Actinoalloteichus hymeniacidonis]MBB5905790.1 hypothetical protein [Actinoalloteichus hymeniacidonis]
MTGQPRQRGRTRRWSPWSLLLLVPLLILVTPLFNRMEPTLIGMPFFYWVQFLFIPIGITCTAIVANRTRQRPDAATDETEAAGGEQR